MGGGPDAALDTGVQILIKIKTSVMSFNYATTYEEDYLSQDPLSEEPSHKRVPSTISVHNVRTGEGRHGVAPHLTVLHRNDWT